MKKFFVFVLVLALLAGGYMVATGQIRLSNTDAGRAVRASATSAVAEASRLRAEGVGGKSVLDESALEGAKRVDDQIWSALRKGDTGSVKSLFASLDPNVSMEAWVSNAARKAPALNKRHVHIVAEAGDTCMMEAVHYLVTFTNNGNDYDEENLNYTLSLRKTNGKWEPAALTEAETESLTEKLYQNFKAEAIEAFKAGRNMAPFGNWMWTQRDGVEEGVYSSVVAYMYQAENGDVIVLVALENGTKEIKRVRKMDVTITDDQLGQVLKVSESCNVSVLPGTVEMYEIRVPAAKVKKGTWTSMQYDIHTDY